MWGGGCKIKPLISFNYFSKSQVHIERILSRENEVQCSAMINRPFFIFRLKYWLAIENKGL
jgi:hypothetical protein